MDFTGVPELRLKIVTFAFEVSAAISLVPSGVIDKG
jgi:hypothetical protein